MFILQRRLKRAHACSSPGERQAAERPSVEQLINSSSFDRASRSISAFPFRLPSIYRPWSSAPDCTARCNNLVGLLFPVHLRAFVLFALARSYTTITTRSLERTFCAFLLFCFEAVVPRSFAPFNSTRSTLLTFHVRLHYTLLFPPRKRWNQPIRILTARSSP